MGNEDIRLFEIARVFLPGGDLPDEHVRVAGIFEGDFPRAKGVVESIYAALKGEAEFERASDALFHPGKAAKTGAGPFGVLHPTLLEGTWSGFELDLEQLLQASRDPVAYDDVITYPSVRQDLAFSVPEDVPAGDLVSAAHEAAGDDLREMRAFDVYRGGQVGEGRKSIAFSVSFQSEERTLSDEDAAALREKIVEALSSRFGAELRA
jgi:phenylalanyl-tRNA synthetase beta chain